MLVPSFKGRSVMPSPQTAKLTPIPPPNDGINAVGALAGGMQPTESIFQFNLIPSQYGSKVRAGYELWADAVDGGGVKTLIPYKGSTSSADRLFAAGESGIYNITSAGSGPWAADIAFGSVVDTSGIGAWTNQTTIGGRYVLYCDEANGYYFYKEGGVWTKVAMGVGATQISNVDPATFVFVMVWKTRPWFIVRDSTKSYYLKPGTVFGEAVEFDWGNKFKHGGNLAMLINWTVDGGEGVDDHLIAISTTGDVVVYKGTDPSDASKFGLHGSWYIGDLPEGRRGAGSFGGEVYILSRYGVLPMSRLISGSLVQKDDIYLSRKITPLVNNQMFFSRTSHGWEVKLIPGEQLLMVANPKREGFPHLQFVQSLNNEAWASYRDFPLYTGEVWNDIFYFADMEGNVHIHTGTSDARDIDGENGIEITWSCLQAFSDLQEPGQYHITQYIRPVFLADARPSFSVESRYDYNIADVAGTSSPTTISGALWDVAIWDADVWGGEFSVIQGLVGGYGIGRAVAVGLFGSSSGNTTLIRYDLVTTAGGPT